jgi:uncharacterized repeat protein (TIGR02543 family)
MRKTKLLSLLALLLTVTQGAWGTTVYVSTYAELSEAISNASVDNIIVTADIDVPCGTSGNAGSTDMSGASTAQLIINRSLTLQSQAGSKYIIKRVAANGANSTALKSMIAIRGNGQGTSGTANLTENTIQVTFTNIIIDGGANWKGASVNNRRSAAANAYDCSGRATIDIYLGGMLNLEDGVEIQNGFTTKPDNSLLNDPSCSACFGGAIRVDYHNATGGGTVNIKAGATIHDCTARSDSYGGALGAYNYARLNLYGGTIYNCSANDGGAIACTYRSGSVDATAGTIRMYGGTISNCCAENGGALSTHGPVNDYVLGGTITSCSATNGGAISQAYGATVIHTVHQNSGELTISNCTNTNETSTANTGGYRFIHLDGGSINVTSVYQVTFRDNNTNFAVLSVPQGTSLGEAFPAAPVNASLRFVGWFNGDTQVTSTTVINSDITVTAKWTENTVTLTDGQGVTALDTYKEQEIWVNYTRSFTEGKTSTVCLPFAYTKKEGDGSFYAFTNIEKNGSGEYVATMTEPGVSTLTANTPYLYMPIATGNVDFSGPYTIPATLTAGSTTSNGWTFKGTYSTIEWEEAPTGIYGFSAQDINDIYQGEFVKVGSYVRIKPMRCYLENESFAGARGMNRAAKQLPETIKVRLISANGEVTGIGTISTKTGEGTIDNGAWYSLDGRRIEGKPSTKGVYINNGNKVVIK